MAEAGSHKQRLGYTDKVPHQMKKVSWVRRRRAKTQIDKISQFSNDDVGRGNFYDDEVTIFRQRRKNNGSV